MPLVIYPKVWKGGPGILYYTLELDCKLFHIIGTTRHGMEATGLGLEDEHLLESSVTSRIEEKSSTIGNRSQAIAPRGHTKPKGKLRSRNGWKGSLDPKGIGSAGHEHSSHGAIQMYTLAYLNM